jgi:predicted RNase H-like nuclease (RuvC/YqgF family)
VTLLEEENHKLRHELTVNTHSDDRMRNEIEHLKDIVKSQKRDIERLQTELQTANAEKGKVREYMS